MRNLLTKGTPIALIFSMLLIRVALAQGAPSSAGAAAFVAGDFNAAAAAYAAAAAKNPDDVDAQLGLGTIELYRNHLSAAREHLQRALTLAPGTPLARARLEAIEMRTGAPADYRITFAGSEARIPLVAIDPLPTFEAKINGRPVRLMIDTGAPNLDLSEAAVKRLHLATSDAGQGVFAGGLKAHIRSLHVDRFEAAGVTVQSMSGGTIPGSGGFPGVDGVVGTGFLYHFLTTIDYRNKILVLRPAGDSAAFLASAKAAAAATMPMWLAGDHFILVRAHVNAAPEGMFFVDTGGAGVGVDLTEASLATSGITPDATHAQTMQGGGGVTEVLPFTAASVTVGAVTLHDIPGVYVPGGGMDRLFSFAVAGTLSHEFFRHTAVTFDFASMTLVLQ